MKTAVKTAGRAAGKTGAKTGARVSIGRAQAPKAQDRRSRKRLTSNALRALPFLELHRTMHQTASEHPPMLFTSPFVVGAAALVPDATDPRLLPEVRDAALRLEVLMRAIDRCGRAEAAQAAECRPLASESYAEAFAASLDLSEANTAAAGAVCDRLSAPQLDLAWLQGAASHNQRTVEALARQGTALYRALVLHCLRDPNASEMQRAPFRQALQSLPELTP
ncbi:MAG: hypothetical protein LCH84_18140 [Gemmatimonadetes bacterium]|nr:hypothetical protein [Gemmatimonadota bacterium]